MQIAPDVAASDSTDVLWSYKLHEEMVLYQRLNFFVVAESMLFAAYATLLAGSGKGAGLMTAISILGLFLGFISIYINIRQTYIINLVSLACQQKFIDYANLKAQRALAPVSSLFILTYAVPLAIILAWFVALAAAGHLPI